jgi:trk system potassium uptake protein
VHVIVVGCGRVGAGLAQACLEMGHTVAVIDRREKAFNRLGDSFSGKTVVGVGFDRDRLTDAGIEHAGALAAVTNGDNSNILVARVARETFGIERVVARIYDPRRAAIYERVGIPTIATVQWATERVLHRILPDRPTSDWVDPSAKVMLVERPIPAVWAGSPVLDVEAEERWRIVSLTRLGIAQIPSPGLVAQDGDVIHVAVLGDASDAFEAHLATGPAHGGAH